MKTLNHSVALGVLCLAAGVFAGSPVRAQDAASPQPGAAYLDEVIVTGTRSAGRTALQSSAPVSVIRAEDISDLGFGDVARSIQYLEPSLNYPRASTTATAANSRPLTLRGLSPDQVLVLVNGKRRHTTSILNINNTVGRGAAGVDFDLIPAAAIERIEVLRDGAVAQYGSDAIAGVINVILRDDDEGGVLAVQAGATAGGDGDNGSISGLWGVPLGDLGRLTVSGEYRHQDSTNRANVDQRFGRVTYQFGDPEIELLNLAVDGDFALGGGELYGFATYSRKESVNPAGFRVPTFLPALYPDGFLPMINPTVTDGGFSLGWRREFDGWLFDVSHTFGVDEADFRVFDTANVSLDAASPTAFDSGSVRYRQNVTDLTLSRPFPRLFAGADLTIGLQHRAEDYSSEAGEPAAFFGAGADGFAGFNPAFRASREARAAFVDVELKPIERLSLGVAARYDDYDDFGQATTWKAGARYALTEVFALRASAGKGFRAPSLQQQQFRLASGALSGTGTLTTVGTLPVSDPVARLLGAQPLRPEDSRNVALGFLVDAGGFSLTADWFRIEIDDRIILSEQFGGAAVTAILTAAGITNFQQVRFFSNAADTTTDGFEIAARYRRSLGDAGDLRFALGYAESETTLDTLRPNTVLPSLSYLGMRARIHLVSAQPDRRITFEAEYDRGPFSLQTNVSHFGTYSSAAFGDAFVQEFGAKTVVDVSGRWRFNPRLSLAVGVQNLADVEPDQPIFNSLPAIIRATGGSFPTTEESPIGVNGRTYFVRLETRF